MFNHPDILTQYESRIVYHELRGIQAKRAKWLERPHWSRVKEIFVELERVSDDAEISRDFSGSAVQIGLPGEIAPEALPLLEELYCKLIPWRKGPFNLFGKEIDAEWRSDLKWQRILPFLPELGDMQVADVGCNNGYYMFRMREFSPALVLGIDPVERCYFSFHLFQHFLRDPSLYFEMFGIEHMGLFPKFFDVVLCMGILYHNRSPLDSLIALRESLKPGGHLLLECIVVPGDERHALCVGDRYAQMRNVYFIPTAPGLCSWAEKAGFVDVELRRVDATTAEEQRSTEYMPYESYADSIDPRDSTKTVEGYPAPLRAIVTCRRRER